MTQVRSVFNSIGGDTVPQGGNRGKGRGLRRKPMNSVCDILSLRYLQSITWKIQWAAGMWLPRRERGLSYRRAQKTVSEEQKVTCETTPAFNRRAVEENPQKTVKGNTQGRNNIREVQEGNASRRRPWSMSNSKGRSNQMRTEKYALAFRR